MADGFRLPPFRSWGEFVDAACVAPSIEEGRARIDRTEWAGSTFDEAVRLARDGWQQPLRQVDVTVEELRDRAGLGTDVTRLEPTWDVSGGEVDIGAYQSGIPECMIESYPVAVSERGKVVTFVVPIVYVHTVETTRVINRGLALAALCASIIGSGHSVEIWAGDTGHVDAGTRFSVMINVLAAGEPLDPGRLVFALAHPGMVRRLTFGLWDAQPPDVARTMVDAAYGHGPYDCREEDLPEDIRGAYVFPYLSATDSQWDDLDTALEWCHTTFADLGLLHRPYRTERLATDPRG